MRISRMVWATVVVAGIAVTAAFVRQQAMVEQQSGLLARAKVTPDQAEQTVLAAYPGARISESEIEDEDGRLIYSFDLVVGGEKQEVEIDAITGEILPADADDEDDDEDDDDAKGKGR